MDLLEALETLNQPSASGLPPFRVFLACGFTPLHLKTFVAAHAKAMDTTRAITVDTGRFGDLAGTLERLDPASADTVVVVVEWFDLDSRLGLRELGGWREDQLADIATSVDAVMGRILRAVEVTSRHVPVLCVLPTLPMPPLFPEPPVLGGVSELQIRASLANLAVTLGALPGVVVLNHQELDLRSPVLQRLDVKAAVSSGFPYTVSHASALGQLVVEVVRAKAPKKGLITDLDDTLWSGLVGEIGIEHIAWTLGDRAVQHGLYQQLLASLASSGVLIAVASKNDARVVDAAFDRRGLLLGKDAVFPFEVTWARKSESVERILKTWNIGPDAVVFVDDNPMEVAEVQSAFPSMDCRVFPKSNVTAVWALIHDLRRLFGKRDRSSDDRLRAESIRQSARARQAHENSGFSEDEFLRSADAHLRIERPADTRRAFELLNKTNQFNLNGRRLDEAAWNRYLERSDTFLLTVTYQDKWAQLGQIAVVLGTVASHGVALDQWVMSCRAFSRRIEYQCLRYIFDKFGVNTVRFDFKATLRNQPLVEFLTGVLGEAPEVDPVLTREQFNRRTPVLFHTVEERQ